jgi:hypothetical protein
MRNILLMVRLNSGYLLPPFAFWSHPSPFFLFYIEIYCYLRSPYRDLGVYDSVVQVRTHRNAMTCVHMADFRFAQKSMTPHRVSLLPLHTSARAVGNLVSGRNHHVHSHPISGHRIHIHILLRFRNGICDPSLALHSPANTIQEDRIAHTARLTFHMSMIAVSHILPVHTHASRVRESDEPQRVHSVLPSPT